MKIFSKNNRKFLLVLPMLVLPFLALGFYALGGGDGRKATARQPLSALNAQLPDANLIDTSVKDKMSFYALASRLNPDTGSASLPLAEPAAVASFDEAQIQQTISRINHKIAEASPPAYSPASIIPPSGIDRIQVEKLETLMKAMKQPAGEDPEMAQLSTMMDKIIAIQNPGLVSSVSTGIAAKDVDSQFHAIPAVLTKNQKVTQGSVIEIQTQDTITISGQTLPKGQLLYGTAEFSNQRLNLQIKTIRLGTSIIPVNLVVYDTRDAMAGINTPEAQLLGAVNSGAADAVSGIGIGGFDQSLSTQIAGAGIDAAKSLFQKKIKRIKVKLKAGYPLLIKNNKY